MSGMCMRTDGIHLHCFRGFLKVRMHMRVALHETHVLVIFTTTNHTTWCGRGMTTWIVGEKSAR